MLRALREGNVPWQGGFDFRLLRVWQGQLTPPNTYGARRYPTAGLAQKSSDATLPSGCVLPGLPLLAQERQKHFVAFANRLRRKQAEVSNPVPVSIRDLIRQTGDELANGIDGGDGPTQLLIFGQKTDLLVFAGEQPILGQRRPAQVSSDISEKGILGFVVVDLRNPQAVAVMKQFH